MGDELREKLIHSSWINDAGVYFARILFRIIPASPNRITGSTFRLAVVLRDEPISEFIRVSVSLTWSIRRRNNKEEKEKEKVEQEEETSNASNRLALFKMCHE